MGLQTITCYSGALWLGSIFFIHGMMQKRANAMEDVFSKYFIDPTDRNNWNNIMTVFEPHIYKNISPTGSTPSKPPRQIDGGYQPLTASKLGADYAAMYDQANSLGLLLDPDAMAYYYDETIDPIQNIEATMRWDMLLTSYIVLKNMEDVIGLIVEAIRPIYRSSGSKNLTPAQLWFHMDEFAHGTLFRADALTIVPWETVDQFRTDNPSNLGIVDVILNYYHTELWYINIPTITIGDESDSFSAVSTSGFRVLSPSSGLPYAVSSSFSPLGDPPASCTFITEYYNSRVIRFNIIGDDGGNISSSYKTLTVS